MEILHWEKMNECVSTQGTELDVTTPKTNESWNNTLKNVTFYDSRIILEWFRTRKCTCDVTRPVGYFQSGLALPSIPGAVI